MGSRTLSMINSVRELKSYYALTYQIQLAKWNYERLLNRVHANLLTCWVKEKLGNAL